MSLTSQSNINRSDRVMYTTNNNKTFRYTFCLLFNSINADFTELDMIDIDILIELSNKTRKQKGAKRNNTRIW